MARPRPRPDGRTPAVDLPDLGGLRLRDGRLAVTVIANGPEISGHIGLTATGTGGPARAGAAFRLAGSDVDLSDIDFDAGGVAVKGSGAFKGGEPTLADLTVAVGPGAFLNEGHAAGRVQIAPASAGSRARLNLSGVNLAFPGGGGQLESVSLTADGPLARLPYRLEARGAASGLAGRLSGSGVLAGSAGDRTVTFAGAGRVGAADFRTVEPAQIDLRPSGVSGALHLTVDKGGASKGRADLTFTQAGDSLNGRAVVAGLGHRPDERRRPRKGGRRGHAVTGSERPDRLGSGAGVGAGEPLFGGRVGHGRHARRDLRPGCGGLERRAQGRPRVAVVDRAATAGRTLGGPFPVGAGFPPAGLRPVFGGRRHRSPVGLPGAGPAVAERAARRRGDDRRDPCRPPTDGNGVHRGRRLRRRRRRARPQGARGAGRPEGRRRRRGQPCRHRRARGRYRAAAA